MIGRPISHLVPSVEPMAVCAKQPQVSFIGGPIAEAVIPDGGSPFVAELLRWVNVVNVENAIVTFSAVNARASQLGNESKLARPIARVLVLGEAVFVPVIFTALLGAKAMLAFVAAAFAPLLSLPSRLKVAVSAAILPGTIFDAILMGFEGLRAVAASHCDGCLFHCRSIASRIAYCNFDIACKRIEDAQRQGDLFIGERAA